MNQKQTIGLQIKKARKEKKLSQLKLSEIVNISRMMISRYETGSNNIPLRQLQKIANALEKPIAYFFKEETYSFSPKEMLAFSIEDTAKTREATHEAKILMKNWYLAHNMQSITKQTFDEWWITKK